MNVTGIIAEYNPFHNGHALHLKKARQLTKADVVIAIMSGSFVQRGEPAIMPKWERAEMAVKSGVDLVIELPVFAATQQAEIFANKAIEILAALKVNQLFFGSEHGNSEAFDQLALQMTNHSDAFESNLRLELAAKQIAYPAAFAAAIQKTFPTIPLDITKPNNILGFHYALAIAKNKFAIRLATMPRAHTDFHDSSFTHSSIASATAIRNTLLKEGIEAISPFIPPETETILNNYAGKFVSWEDYYPFLRYRLLTARSNDLAITRLVDEGIENRMRQQAAKNFDFVSFLKAMQTKRYSNARIQRTALQILLNQLKTDHYQPYIRILGMTKTGQNYLTTIKKQVSMPIISTVSKAPTGILDADLQASAIYTLPPELQSYRQADFEKPPFII